MRTGIDTFRKTNPPSGRSALPSTGAPAFFLIETTSKVSAVVVGGACVNTGALATANMHTTSLTIRARAFVTTLLVERRRFLQLRVADDVVLDPQLRTRLL